MASRSSKRPPHTPSTDAVRTCTTPDKNHTTPSCTQASTSSTGGSRDGHTLRSDRRGQGPTDARATKKQNGGAATGSRGRGGVVDGGPTTTEADNRATSRRTSRRRSAGDRSLHPRDPCRRPQVAPAARDTRPRGTSSVSAPVRQAGGARIGVHPGRQPPSLGPPSAALPPPQPPPRSVGSCRAGPLTGRRRGGQAGAHSWRGTPPRRTKPTAGSHGRRGRAWLTDAPTAPRPACSGRPCFPHPASLQGRPGSSGSLSLSPAAVAPPAGRPVGAAYAAGPPHPKHARWPRLAGGCPTPRFACVRWRRRSSATVAGRGPTSVERRWCGSPTPLRKVKLAVPARRQGSVVAPPARPLTVLHSPSGAPPTSATGVGRRRSPAAAATAGVGNAAVVRRRRRALVRAQLPRAHTPTPSVTQIICPPPAGACRFQGGGGWA